MIFPLKSRSIKLSFKNDAHPAYPCPMFPCCSTKWSHIQDIPKLTNTFILALGSHAPGAAARPLDQLCLARRTREAPRLRNSQQDTLARGLPHCSSASQRVPCPLIHYFKEAMGHRNFCHMSRFRDKAVGDEDGERSESFKIQNWISCSTGEQRKNSGKTAFHNCLRAEARFTPGFLSFCGLGKECSYLKYTSPQVPWQALDSTLTGHIQISGKHSSAWKKMSQQQKTGKCACLTGLGFVCFLPVSAYSEIWSDIGQWCGGEEWGQWMRESMFLK